MLRFIYRFVSEQVQVVPSRIIMALILVGTYNILAIKVIERDVSSRAYELHDDLCCLKQSETSLRLEKLHLSWTCWLSFITVMSGCFFSLSLFLHITFIMSRKSSFIWAETSWIRCWFIQNCVWCLVDRLKKGILTNCHILCSEILHLLMVLWE